MDPPASLFVSLSAVTARLPDVRGSRRFAWGVRLPFGWVRVGDDAAGFWARPRRLQVAGLRDSSGHPRVFVRPRGLHRSAVTPSAGFWPDSGRPVAGLVNRRPAAPA